MLELPTYKVYDPELAFSCGCGVLFTLPCPGCKEYLGDEYCDPDEEPKEVER